METISQIFDQGAQAVLDTFARSARDLPPMDVKELADICWTHASMLAKARTLEAAIWARAALAGYEILSQSDDSIVSESATESLQALRSWNILRT